MLGLFIELKFCMTSIYFLNYHKNVTCSFISLLQCIIRSHCLIIVCVMRNVITSLDRATVIDAM